MALSDQVRACKMGVGSALPTMPRQVCANLARTQGLPMAALGKDQYALLPDVVEFSGVDRALQAVQRPGSLLGWPGYRQAVTAALLLLAAMPGLEVLEPSADVEGAEEREADRIAGQVLGAAGADVDPHAPDGLLILTARHWTRAQEVPAPGPADMAFLLGTLTRTIALGAACTRDDVTAEGVRRSVAEILRRPYETLGRYLAILQDAREGGLAGT